MGMKHKRHFADDRTYTRGSRGGNMGTNHKHHADMAGRKRRQTKDDGLTGRERRELAYEKQRLNRIASHIKDVDMFRDVAKQAETAKEYADRNGIRLLPALITECGHAIDELGISAKHALMLALVSQKINGELYASEQINYRYAKLVEIANVIAGRQDGNAKRGAIIMKHWQDSNHFTHGEKNELERFLRER